LKNASACRTRGKEIIMLADLLTPTHLIVLLVVAVLLFGAKKIPELGRNLGDGLRGLRDGIKGPTRNEEQSL
jgi:sec-independent protein translocase protein TatA